MHKVNFITKPIKAVQGKFHKIFCFGIKESSNIDDEVVNSFGEEWEKFHDFKDAEIDRIGNMYFDILNEQIINKDSYILDVGCGTGRWSKYLASKVGFIEAVDPSNAIYTAEHLLKEVDNVRFSQAAADNLPFADETFDFGMSVGVLHHIPDTQKAIIDCVKKVKKGGWFYVYLYYNFENKGQLFRLLFSLSTLVRLIVSKLPTLIKKFVCDLIAVFVYMPLVLLGRLFKMLGFSSIAKKIPLNIYQNQSFYIIRNDALDRFGTSLEQRFSRKEISEMLVKGGLDNIIISDNLPYWHAMGQRV